MGIISWIVVGAIAGFLASLVMGSRGGLLMMVILGIVGGLVGGFVATTVLKIGSVNGINVESIVIATVGAIAVVFLVKFRDRFARSSPRPEVISSAAKPHKPGPDRGHLRASRSLSGRPANLPRNWSET